MDRSILVTYASKYGATAEIASKIGDVLRQAGLPVEVISVETVRDITAYQAVVLGSAVYIGKWQKEAVKFLQSNEKDLAGRMVWLFSSGPTGEGDPVKLVEGLRLPTELQTLVDRIQPRGIEVFHGHINTAKISFIEKWAIKNIVKKPFGDFRDWDTIAAWANTIAEALKAAEKL